MSRPTPAELNALANRMTYERARAEAMGFTFHGVSVSEHPVFGLRTEGDFSCVCGRLERFRFQQNAGILSHPEALARWLDVAGELRRYGSFSRDHLLSDGYTPEQVDDIEAKGKAFDDQARAALDEWLTPEDRHRAHTAWRRHGGLRL